MTSKPEPSLGLVRRRSVISGDPSQIVGRPWTDAFYYFVLLAAAAVDVVSFMQVLSAAIDLDENSLIIFVTGFTVVCLALAHTVGQQAKQAVATRPAVGARTIVLAFLAGWVALGLTALLVRWFVQDPGGASSSFYMDGQVQDTDPGADERHLSALLFLALYLATGLISGAAGFLHHNPAARQYKRVLARRSKAAAELAWIDSRVTAATDLAAAIDRVHKEHVTSWAALQTDCVAAVNGLKAESRLSLLMKDPPPIEPHPGRPEELGKELK